MAKDLLMEKLASVGRKQRSLQGFGLSRWKIYVPNFSDEATMEGLETVLFYMP